MVQVVPLSSGVQFGDVGVRPTSSEIAPEHVPHIAPGTIDRDSDCVDGETK